MIEVTRQAETKKDVLDFIVLTGKFGKRFYKVTEGSKGNKKTIKITAIAVSRDLTYILKWEMEGKEVKPKPKDDELKAKKAPRFGLVPKADRMNKFLYHLQNTGDWTDILESRGFLEATELRKDGSDLHA